MKTFLKTLLPPSGLQKAQQFRRQMIRKTRQVAEIFGFNITRTHDFYSPLPNESQLLKNIQRWNKPSRMNGITFDLEMNKSFLSDLLCRFFEEFSQFATYGENQALGFGLGFTELDSLVLYAMIRYLKPKRYLEVGSGLSTYYCSLAAASNFDEGNPLQITCVEPFPFKKLFEIPNITIIQDEVQNTQIELFESLEPGDVLFIDSSHMLRIDGDVPFLYLEVLPIIKPGVIIHIHDIPFPYNIPYPAEQWITGKVEGSPYWPVFWNEAMLLQAFLAFNSNFEILLSTSMIRFHDEQFLKDNISFYKSPEEQPNTFSSIWLKRVK